MYRPSDLFEFLDSIDARPRRSLSQNFLIDQNIINKLVKLCELKKGDHITEIGPGPGGITQKLLQTEARVTAIEKDHKFANELPRLGNVEVIEADALKIDFIGNKIVGNLPFGITTPLLARLIPRYPDIERICVIVQLEVAERMCASAKTRAYGSLSVFLQFYADTEIAFKIAPTCFTPRPRVSAAAVIIRPKKPLLENPEPFFKMVRTAFNHRRKQLRRSLRELYSTEKIAESLAQCGFSEKARPEELTAADFVALSGALSAR